MNNRILTVYAVVTILAICLPTASVRAATYGGGTGDPCDPYQIRTPAQMNTIGQNSGDWGACFKLMADIDVPGSGFNFWVIGNSATKFTGTFDGDGHVIRKLTSAGYNRYVGLFGYTSGATIKDLGLENVNIFSGDYFVGGLIGYNYSGTVTDCYALGNVSGGSYVGGLIGYNLTYSTITNCYAMGEVTRLAAQHNPGV